MNHQSHEMPRVETLRTLETLARIVLGYSSITLEVFLTKPSTFGNRYYGIARLILGFLAIQLMSWAYEFWWLVVVQLPSPSYSLSIQWFGNAFRLAYIGFGIAHLYLMARRNNQGIPWHAHSFGNGYLGKLKELPALRLGSFRLAIDHDWTIHRYVQPALCFLIAFLLLPHSYVRFWIMWAAIALLLHHNILFNDLYQPTQDVQDRAIERKAHETGKDQLDGYLAPLGEQEKVQEETTKDTADTA